MLKITQKPKYSSKATARSNSSSLREEIESLNAQKMQLISKKEDLEHKIDVLQRTCHYKPSQSIHGSELDDEYQALLDYIEQQKEEIYRLKQTDEAALRQELQEEIKTAYLERMRLQDIQIQQQKDYNDVRDKLDNLNEKEGPDASIKLKEKIEHYESVLEKYKKANHKLKGRIETMKANKAFSDEKGRKKVQKRQEEIANEIIKTRKEIAELERKIEDEKEDHRQKLRDIRLNRSSEK
ncbi:hypothetical protein TRFO_32019 [Tritrichomonas foetus]|uniref:Lebercilin domain-containing protein n=1 Tax=Tritrichomonas foetus TaxID=1144522 RepID=A0A1J4JS26_9EUKA|nr:hypothetical protein TRFO_32019 [Tritrichomonas foetus]|eukprot:OHT01232.1 hypothetical protein TRFO_32019 [Tritrichomonas foetus]